ncbi:hypothetical protein O181_085354 [Austropuccinia psidii MF-1]|uniref:Uncharacterized protein n=1 Tax=Austropuccinia psidii MF-1 TaxID=1389203 RepID=A0A9Q3FUV9_9BASI|nr:hypothetical protein [Austropuccinia psidii MF-1]
MGFKWKKQNQPNSPQQDSPIPSLPHKQSLRQPTPGPSGTQWSEDLLCSKPPKTPIPGPSPSSKPHEDVPTCEPEPEVAPTQSMEEPFALPTPSSPLTIHPLDPPSLPVPLRAPVPRSPHSHNDARQEFTNSQLTLMIPNRILLMNCQLLHMIPFVDALGIPGGTKIPPCPGTGGLSKGGHHWDSLQIFRKIKFKKNAFFPLFIFCNTFF